MGFLPTLLAVGTFSLLLVMDAPRSPLTISSVAAAGRNLGVTGAVAITGVAVAVSVTLQPLQFRLVQLLEGYWPTGHRGVVFRTGIALQRWRYRRLRRRLVVHRTPDAPGRRRVMEERMLAAELRLRLHFPEEQRLLPTALGNVLRSAEDRVGRRYGFEAVTIWPRLFPLLPKDFQATLEDEVTQLDVSTRLTVTWGVTAAATTSLILWNLDAVSEYPLWLIVPAFLWLLSWLSYRSAIESALAHGTDLEVAIDLYRSRVISAMRLPTCSRLSEERRVFRRLCRLYTTYDKHHGFEFMFQTPEATAQEAD